ncbi:hypothetical protein ABIF96_002626 [Bradyrhizobium ottawaense]|uniref:hypothetical protein n=1 Tax=Bradyrhizobium ottawaense TaxID=931866 RepID=UPI00383245C1
MPQAITHLVIRNPFGTMDAPSPDDYEVMAYAATATLPGGAADGNAPAWAAIAAPSDPLEGIWASRWNGGADPTIAGDTAETWKQGRRGSAHHGQPYLSALRLGQWPPARADRGRTRGRGSAGRKICQPDHAGDHTAMGRTRHRR